MSAPSTSAPAAYITASPVPDSSPVPSAAPALTTPFVFPTKCTRVYTLASANSTYQSFAQLSETFLYVPTTDTQWQSCQPPKNASGEGGERHGGRAYSAAVCPEGWMAWSVGLSSRFVSYEGDKRAGNERSRTWSTAFCCESGHDLVDDIWTLYSPSTSPFPKVCAHALTAPYFSTLPITRSSFAYFELPGTFTTTADSNGLSETIVSATTITISAYTDISSTISLPSGRAFYPAWSVEWEGTDNPTLSPQWPILTSDMLIPTWMPGEAVPSGINDNRGGGVMILPRHDLEEWVLPVLITLGVFLALSFGALVFALWRLMRERRRRKAAEMKEYHTHLNEAAAYHEPANEEAARRVSMKEAEGARVVNVRRSTKRSNNGHLNINASNESNAPLNGNCNGNSHCNGGGNRNSHSNGKGNGQR